MTTAAIAAAKARPEPLPPGDRPDISYMLTATLFPAAIIAAAPEKLHTAAIMTALLNPTAPELTAGAIATGASVQPLTSIIAAAANDEIRSEGCSASAFKNDVNGGITLTLLKRK